MLGYELQLELQQLLQPSQSSLLMPAQLELLLYL
jgi:hypothetical protein